MKTMTLKQRCCPKCQGVRVEQLVLNLLGFVESGGDKNSGFVPVKYVPCSECQGTGHIISETQTVCMGAPNGIN